MGAPPAASRAGLIPQPHLEARPSPSGLPALPSSAPRPGPATRTFSRSLWGSGLALPSTHSRSLPSWKRPPPAGGPLYGRRDCRKLLWPQLSMLGLPRSLAAPPWQEARVQSTEENARTKREFPFRLFRAFLIARGEGGSESSESPPRGVGS